MIENSYVYVDSNGKRVAVEYLEDGELREGPATFPARYASFAAICQYINTQFNGHELDLPKLVEIQGLLGSPWPEKSLKFYWKDCPEKAGKG